MSLKKSFFLFLFLISLISQIHPAFAESEPINSDDVTLIGINDAIYSLTEAKTAEIITADQLHATLEVNDVIVEKDRVLVRIIIWGLPVTWGDKVIDQNRIYGSYLPVAELGIPSGKWLTPSSGSRYSLLSNGNTLVIAGLLEFLTDEQPAVVSFNFNQIPFDMEILSEGSTMILELEKGDHQERSERSPLSDQKDGVVLSLMNTAQTTKTTMIQPGFATIREDESISKIGWIKVERSDGKKYLLTRTDPYGFNLSDDSKTILVDSYTFMPLSSSDPLKIGLDYVYVKRSGNHEVELSFPAPLDFTSEKAALNVEMPLDEFSGKINGYQVFNKTIQGEEMTILRLFMNNDPHISSISFKDSLAEDDFTYSNCGYLPDSDQFACDVQITKLGQSDLTLYFDSFEYRIDGNWEIKWTPVSIAFASNPEPVPGTRLEIDYSKLGSSSSNEIHELTDLLRSFSDSLTANPGWILQKAQTQAVAAGGEYPDLVQHGDEVLKNNRTVSESWDQIDSDGYVINNISLTRDTKGNILTGTWNRSDCQILLPQGYKVPYESGPSDTIYPFLYGNEFFTLLNTSAEFIGRKDCEIDGQAGWCYTFEHSLSSSPDSGQPTFMNRYTFLIDPETGEILREETECQLGGPGTPLQPCIQSKTVEISYRKSLDSELQTMIDSIIF